MMRHYIEYLSFGVFVDYDRQNKGSHCAILKLHCVIRENLNEVFVASIFNQVTLTRLKHGQQ